MKRRRPNTENWRDDPAYQRTAAATRRLVERMSEPRDEPNETKEECKCSKPSVRF